MYNTYISTRENYIEITKLINISYLYNELIEHKNKSKSYKVQNVPIYYIFILVRNNKLFARVQENKQ